ncbi:MAG: tRNA (adenosine(37)-N6)-dimethylallyltransferase MiaA [Bacteroidia bacterium]|jgi:tRNA dimethylallyltransferase
MNAKPIYVVLGPTASGKTRLAVRFAAALNSEIISADSRQVFKDMNLGTGKDYEEYIQEGRKIPVHLIDLAEPGEDFHLTAYMEHFYSVYAGLEKRNLIPVLCGGSGLYLEAVLKGFAYAFVPVDRDRRKDLEAFSKKELEEFFQSLPETPFRKLADTSTHKRLIRAIEISEYLIVHPEYEKILPAFRPIIFGLNPPVNERRKNIEIRLKQRLEAGLVEEVAQLRLRLSDEQLMRYGLEYKFITQYLRNEMSKEKMVQLLTIAIQQFAKRQMTYFRKLEREGYQIHWVNHETSLADLLAVRNKKAAG